MNSKVESYLKDAIFECVSSGDHATAQIILNVIQQAGNSLKVVSHAQFTPKPVMNKNEQEFHSAEFWATFILNNFIPEYNRKNRSTFNRAELDNWILNCGKIKFTEHDEQTYRDGYKVWKKNVSNGLQQLKNRSLIRNEKFCQTWRIVWENH